MNVPFEFTKAWTEYHPKDKGRGGVVVGESRNKNNWIIVKSGRTTRESYAKEFIRVLGKCPTCGR